MGGSKLGLGRKTNIAQVENTCEIKALLHAAYFIIRFKKLFSVNKKIAKNVKSNAMIK